MMMRPAACTRKRCNKGTRGVQRRPLRPSLTRPVRASSSTNDESAKTVDQLKMQLLVISSKTDRGQLLFKEKVYSPLDEYQKKEELEVKDIVEKLIASNEQVDDDNKATQRSSLHDGTWELVFATKQLFRASPFFMAISESMEGYTWHAPWSDPSTAVPSGNLFFRLHELQVMSWGASTVGRVTQTIDTDAKTLSSTFDTILFRLTVIPIVGWWKLLPTFGGRVCSFATNLEMESNGRGGQRLVFELDKTRVDQADGIPKPPFFLAWLLGKEFPVNSVWKLLPWNGGRAPMCRTEVVFVDEDFRICQDKDGEIFVYVRCQGL